MKKLCVNLQNIQIYKKRNKIVLILRKSTYYLFIITIIT